MDQQLANLTAAAADVAAAQGQGQAAAPAPAPAEQGENANGNAPPPEVLSLAPGTPWVFWIRLLQALFAAIAIAVMASTDDFHQVTSFRFLVAAASLQCLWSLPLAAVDVYALLVDRSFLTPRATIIFSIGNWVSGTMILAAATAAAAITTFLDDDMRAFKENHCSSFMVATAMVFLSWILSAPTYIFNLFAAVYNVQRS